MTSHDIESYFRQHRKMLAMILLVIGMLAVSGFFMGMRQTETSATAAGRHRAANRAVPTDTAVLLPAPRYSEIASTPWQVNAGWKFTLEDLPRVTAAPDSQTKPTPEQAAAAVALRARLRAYDGAPPVIPHPIDPLGSAACASCHDRGSDKIIAGVRPAEMSHPWITNCTSCHVPQQGPREASEAQEARLHVDNTFLGKPSPGSGCRAYQGAPPVMPHQVWMRQNCMSCHGPGRDQAIRSTHPQRRNCLQCHAPDAALDNRESYLGNAAPPVAAPAKP